MTTWHGYICLEDLGLNAQQRQTLAGILPSCGPCYHRSPACICHARMRLDNDATLVEARFAKSNLTIAKFKAQLAELFGVSPDDITHSTAWESYAGYETPLVTFSYNSVEYLLVALFGGTNATWQESGDEARGYIALNLEAWEGTQ